MEFNEKLRELRKSRSLTQEELAEAIFVSRTAVSKWESGRGYPNIDSLKELARFFSVSIDELIRPDEIITAAEQDKKAFVNTYVTQICCALDMLSAVLLFIPVFGNGTDAPSTTSLLGLTGLNPWVKAVFAVVMGLTILNGAGGALLSGLDKPLWSKRLIAIGMVLSVTCVAIFIATRQPYAGIICFALLIIKGYLITRIK